VSDPTSKTDRPPPLLVPRPNPRPTPFVPSKHLPAPQSAPFAAERPTRPGPEPRIDSPPPTRRQDAPPNSVSPDVDRAIGKVTRAALSRLWPILLAGGLGSGGAIIARPTSPPERVDAQGQELSATRQRVGELEDEVTELKAQVRAQRRHNIDQQSWLLEVLAVQNVHVRRPDNMPPPSPVDTVPPIRKPKGGTMVVLDSPPTPP